MFITECLIKRESKVRALILESKKEAKSYDSSTNVIITSSSSS